MRGVTLADGIIGGSQAISTRTPHAGSDGEIDSRQRHAQISTRTPHAGSDTNSTRSHGRQKGFQPALPMRGVTVWLLANSKRLAISTRTPHAGSDL